MKQASSLRLPRQSLFTFLLWPDAARELQTDDIWFNWEWGEQRRIVIADDNSDDHNIAILQRWYRTGFDPHLVWRNRPTKLLDHPGLKDLNPLGAYLLEDDRYEVLQLMCNPDPDLEAYWERVCQGESPSFPAGDSVSAEFWEAYGQSFNEWLKDFTDSERSDLEPRRAMTASEFRPVQGMPGLFEHRAFPAARIQLTDDGLSYARGALLRLPALAQQPPETDNQVLAAAWWRCLRETADPPIDRIQLLRRPLPAFRPDALSASDQAGGGGASSVEVQAFTPAESGVTGRATWRCRGADCVLELRLIAERPTLVRLRLLDPRQDSPVLELSAKLESLPDNAGALWTEEVSVPAECTGVEVTQDDGVTVLTLGYASDGVDETT